MWVLINYLRWASRRLPIETSQLFGFTRCVQSYGFRGTLCLRVQSLCYYCFGPFVYRFFVGVKLSMLGSTHFLQKILPLSLMGVLRTASGAPRPHFGAQKANRFSTVCFAAKGLAPKNGKNMFYGICH